MHLGRKVEKEHKNKDRTSGLARVMYNPPWFAHLGNLLPSTKITFLVELRRPRDPLGVANTQDITLGILERV